MCFLQYCSGNHSCQFFSVKTTGFFLQCTPQWWTPPQKTCKLHWHSIRLPVFLTGFLDHCDEWTSATLGGFGGMLPRKKILCFLNVKFINLVQIKQRKIQNSFSYSVCLHYYYNNSYNINPMIVIAIYYKTNALKNKGNFHN